VTDESARFRLGAYALCLRDNALLLARMAADVTFDAGAWTLPGGGIEFGEHPDAAVLRELQEETGLVGELGTLLGVYSRRHDRSGSSPFHHIGLLYEVRVPEDQLVMEVTGSTDLCAWVPIDTLGTIPLVDLASFAVELLQRRTER
jgi:8-oxo-dGTP diphosphatase